jgi:hypothetical protein
MGRSSLPFGRLTTRSGSTTGLCISGVQGVDYGLVSTMCTGHRSRGRFSVVLRLG